MNAQLFQQRMLILTKAFAIDPGVEKDVLLAHLALCLKGVQANDIQVSENAVSFKGGLFRLVGNWNVLVLFGSGRIVVDHQKHEVRYHLSISQFVIFVTLFVVLMDADIARSPHPGISILWVTIAAFVVLVGVNLVICIPRFNQFLWNAIDSVYSSKR